MPSNWYGRVNSSLCLTSLEADARSPWFFLDTVNMKSWHCHVRSKLLKSLNLSNRNLFFREKPKQPVRTFREGCPRKSAIRATSHGGFDCWQARGSEIISCVEKREIVKVFAKNDVRRLIGVSRELQVLMFVEQFKCSMLPFTTCRVELEREPLWV